jgi:4-methyl-5(b-hydroxyethyl)-thiazole monophosphate biosynthesis
VAPAEFDVLILPGGSAGVQRLRADVRVIVAVRDFARQRKWLAAICAGPLVLHDAGVLAGRSGTCYPGVETDIPELRCARAAVVVDDRIITSQALGTSVAFALRIVAELDSPAKAAKLARSMVVKSKFSI